MANMNTRTDVKNSLSEEEKDEMVVAQADDDEAWEKAQHVRRRGTTSLEIPMELAVRAAFLAQLHHRTDLADWLTRIIQERVELEEAAFAGAKRELASMSRARS
jgi:hypothetical protein